MYSVAIQIDFCYGHRLRDYPGPCRHLHGHNARAEVVLRASDLDRQGMVHELGALRDTIKKWIDATLDHRMLLRQDDPLAPMLQEADEPVYLLAENPTVEVIAETIYRYVASCRLPVVEVRVWEAPHAYASYHHEENLSDPKF